MMIIGILLALLLPAVNATRESARSTQSKNNLKQIGLAIANFRASKGYYPPSWLPGEPPLLGTGYANVDGWSIHILLLPYLEQKLIQRQF
jgi:type II secretory pathway pseudopilin PulG